MLRLSLGVRAGCHVSAGTVDPDADGPVLCAAVGKAVVTLHLCPLIGYCKEELFTRRVECRAGFSVADVRVAGPWLKLHIIIHSSFICNSKIPKFAQRSIAQRNANPDSSLSMPKLNPTNAYAHLHVEIGPTKRFITCFLRPPISISRP